MFKDKFQNLKYMLVKKTDGNNKRNIENLVVFLILLIITIIAINTIWGEDKDTKQETNNSSYKQLAVSVGNNINSNNLEITEYNLEQSLEDILSNMAGVGSVNVLVTYSETSEVVAMYNEKSTSSNTDETDTNGGTRKIEETDSNKEIIYEEKDGEKVPITQKVIMPKVEGVIITADGAGDINVKTNIIQAVSAATGISSYRIQVFEKEQK